MKKIIAILLAMVCVFSLAACGSYKKTPTEKPKEAKQMETTPQEETTRGDVTTEEYFEALQNGLIARWKADAANNDGKTKKESRYQLADEELNYILVYYDEPFVDEALGELADRYAEEVMRQQMAAEAYDDPDLLINGEWNWGRYNRSRIIGQFVDSYGFSVPSEYQKEIDSVLEDYKRRNELPSEIRKDMDTADKTLTIHYDRTENGYRIYTVRFWNPTERTFRQYRFIFDFKDEDGNIIETIETEHIAEYVPGYEMETTIMTTVKNPTFTIRTSCLNDD